MDINKKSLLKNTIIGLLSGGALSALYTLNKSKEDEQNSKALTKDEITVPLSRRNFMRAVGKSTGEKSVPDTKDMTDISALTPQELAALKKSLLRKKAASPTKIEEKTGPASSASTVRKSKTTSYATLRNTKGRFSTEKDLSKIAGITEDAAGTMMDTAGGVGGFFAGMTAIKYIADRIMVNRKKQQLEKSRRTYVDMLNKEVNDNDEPYYRKAAADRSLTGTALGLAGLAGIGTMGVAGMVVYRIMENRRKEEEKLLDKDLSRFPSEKTIKYKFASINKENEKKDFFA